MVSRHVVTLANSIVGVSVLAMPFCFKQCGIVLATLCLAVGAVMTRMVCYFLLKAAVMNRRRTYEMLAWSTFGQTGKFMVEISIIGFLIGTLIAFMVVIGDLGPEILSEIFSVENNSSLRTIIMTGLSLFVALPLGLLRNIDSLSSVSTASVLFYLFLVIKIFSDGIGPLWSGEYLERIHFWRSDGVLQCIPIFSMALSCQTQIFGIYDALPEPSVQKMNEVVKQAVTICTFFYFCVGFFGYIAFSNQNFGGNILLSFDPTWSTQLIKSMFLMSVVFSVPLVVFPCRVSLHSLIFKSSTAYHHVHDMATNYIPESRMKFLTVSIVGFTLVVGILIPNIELVLGLVGSTTGSVICIIFPSIMFVRVTSKNTTERLLAQVMFFIGVVLMLLTTYATLYAAEQAQISENFQEHPRISEPPKPIKHEGDQLNPPILKAEGAAKQIHPAEFEQKPPDKLFSKTHHDLEARVSSSAKEDSKIASNRKPVVVKETPIQKQPVKPQAEFEGPQHNKQTIEIQDSGPKQESSVKPKKQEQQQEIKNVQQNAEQVFSNKDKGEAPKDGDKKEYVDKNVAEEFLKRLEEHQENQKKLLEEQKEILEELKQHHALDVKEKQQQSDKDKDQDLIVKVDEKPPIVDSSKPESKDVPVPAGNSNKFMQEQVKIIEQISENIEKENKNAKLLEELKVGLNNEAKKQDPTGVDSQSQAHNENAVPGAGLQQTNTGSDNTPDKLLYPPIVNSNASTVDKDKGILLGSFANASPPVKAEPSPKPDLVNVKPADKKEEDSQKLNTNVKKIVAEPLDQSSKRNVESSVVDTAAKSKADAVISPAPPKRSVASESVPKEKVDREI